jgi:nitroreductase
MDIYEAIRQRHSCRAFEARDLDEALLEKILDAARQAPSAKNLQPARIVVVRDAGTRAKLAEAAKGQRFVGEAPVVLAFCAEGDTEYRMTCGQLAYPIDCAILQDHVSLLAAAEGLGTCWIGAFYEDRVKEILGIPEAVRVTELMPIGWPAAEPAKRTPRRDLGEILHRERW